MGFVVWLAVVAAVSVVLCLALRREFRRLRREAILAPIAREWGEYKRQVGERFLPVVVRITADVQPFIDAMERVAKSVSELPREDRR